MKTQRIIAFALLVAAALIVVRFVAFQGGDDKKLIRQALEESIQASKEGRPGGVMDKISDSLKVNQSEVRQAQIADFIKNQKPSVYIPDSEPVVTGDTGEIHSSVTVETMMAGSPQRIKVPDVTLVFKREDARAYLIFPTKQWRLSEVRLPADVFSELGFGG